MGRFHSLRESCCLFIVWIAALQAAQAAPSEPTLAHSAPLLGRTLTLSVDGAMPGAPIDLFYAPQAGVLQTPYGGFELNRTSARRIRNGMADVLGHWSTDIPLPLHAGLAEIEGHFQMLVTNTSASAGKVFSNAVHLRLLGPRVHASFRGGPASNEAGLAIVSAVSDHVVATVAYGVIDEEPGALHEGKPVFDASRATGAVMASRTRLVFFDPFFGGTRSVHVLQNSSRQLIGDAARGRVYVLETGSTAMPAGARVRVFDFRSQQEIAHLDLPNPAATQWCANADASEAYVAEYEQPSGRTAMRRVDLVNLVDRGSAQVGGATSRVFDDMTLASGQLFVTTSTVFAFQDYGGWLTRVRFTNGTPITVVEGGSSRLPRIAAVPDVNRLLVPWFLPFVPATGLTETTLSAPGPYANIALPWVYLVVNDLAVEGSQVWVLDSGDNEPPGGTEPGRLYRLDMVTHTWTQYPHTWAFVGPRDMEIVRDALVDKIYLANRGFGPPMNLPPELFVIDRAHATEGHVVLQNSPEVLSGAALD